MAIVLTDDKHYEDIAKSIRNNLPLDNHGELRPNEMADAIQQACDNKRDEGIGTGYHEGQESGYTSGLADGKVQGMTEEQIRQWNVIQDDGNRSSYVYAFGSTYTAESFLPIRDFDVTNANGMFSNFGRAVYNRNGGQYIPPAINLRQLFIDRNIKFSTKRSNNFAGFATSAWISELPTIDLTGCTNQISTFVDQASYLVKIEKLIVCESNKFHDSNGFVGCSRLEELEMEGVLTSTLNLQPAPLNKKSITSVIGVLSEDEGVTGKTLKLKKSAVDKAFETSEGANNGSASTEWAKLIEPKGNWTISLL